MKKAATKAKAKKKVITSFIVRSITPKDRTTLDLIKKRLQQVTDSQCLAMVLSDYWAMKEDLRTERNANSNMLNRFADVVNAHAALRAAETKFAEAIKGQEDVPNLAFIQNQILQ